MSKAQNFSTRTGKTILEEEEDEPSRSLPPLLRRNSTEVATALTKNDQALLDDMLEADSEKENVPQTATKTVREEFENVQQGCWLFSTKTNIILKLSWKNSRMLFPPSKQVLRRSMKYFNS